MPLDTAAVAEMRGRFRTYFSGDQDARRARAKRNIKLATIWVGAALWTLTVPISLYQAHRMIRDGLASAPILEIAVVMVGLGIVGGLVFAIGTWERLWDDVLHNFRRYFLWLLVVPIGLIGAWGVHYYLGSETWRDAIGFASVAIGFFGLAFRYHPPVRQKQVEEEMDTAFDADIRRYRDDVLRQLYAEAPSGGRNAPSDKDLVVLRRFPENTVSGSAGLRARLGEDSRPRISPQGFVALTFGNNGVVSYEGSIEVTTGELLHHRLREFGYRDVTMISLDGSGSPSGIPKMHRAGTPRLLRMPGRRPAPGYKDVFSIGLAGTEPITVVLRNGDQLRGMKAFEGVPESEIDPLTKWETVRHVWETLSTRKAAAS